jgi:hypothetical protein
VTGAADSRTRLRKARSTAEILDATYGAFTDMLGIIRRYEDGGGPFYAALVFAGAAAANGRDAMLFAPSMPPRSLHEQIDTVVSGGSEAVAAELALLSQAVIGRLTEAAAIVDVERDRGACRDGVWFAREIHALVTGSGP